MWGFFRSQRNDEIYNEISNNNTYYHLKKNVTKVFCTFIEKKQYNKDVDARFPQVRLK
jgi:hypothetical protein